MLGTDCAVLHDVTFGIGSARTEQGALPGTPVRMCDLTADCLTVMKALQFQD